MRSTSLRADARRNRLIWGDNKKYVLPSLLPEFAGKVDLIYIDPPFDTGTDFSFTRCQGYRARLLSATQPFPFSRPTAFEAAKCIYNLAPCENEFERAMIVSIGSSS